jgi:hypothetical protein
MAHMQFDFFNDDNSSVSLRNDVILALEHDDAAAAQSAWQTLVQHYPNDDLLQAFALLITALGGRRSTGYDDHAALSLARCTLQESIEPAARRSLGQQATPWLQRRWRELAQRAATLSYHADHPQDHAAPLWLRAADWQAGVDAVASIASWRRIPAPLSWMLHAHLALQGVQANWGLLAELAWLSPQRLHDVIAQTADPILQPLVKQFGASFEGDGDIGDLTWFPAWLLIERPTLASALTQAQPSQHTAPEQAMRVLLELLGLEHQGRQRDMIERRKTLRDLHGALHAAYMVKR